MGLAIIIIITMQNGKFGIASIILANVKHISTVARYTVTSMYYYSFLYRKDQNQNFVYCSNHIKSTIYSYIAIDSNFYNGLAN